ncbi:MAG: alpha/beta hydrolase, partial [Clostridia bacterium]|nr:alpha/beta hydrolase [Clostridia bacterium]
TVAPDMPAFGKSAPITTAWSVGDYAEWLKKFIAANGLRGANIIAHSFGARVAFKLLAEDSGLANKLIITGGAGLVKPRSPAYMRQVKRYRRVKKLFPRYAEKHFGSAEYRTLSPVMKESYKLVVNEDLRGCASKITNPTLLIYGVNDTVTPAEEEGKIFNSLIAGSRLEIIEGGHFCFSENYNVFNDLAFEFLK